jgi:serine phosphatase RsbU (regulator of sigma subunit)
VNDEQTCILVADGFPLPEDERSCGEIHESLRRMMASSAKPHLLLEDLNALVWRQFSKRPLIAAQALLLDSRQGTVTACRAGGGKPLKINARGDTDQIALPSAIVIGFSRGSAFEATLNEMPLPIEENDTLLVYSAGITDALGGGNETRAFEAIQRETALAYREDRPTGSPLPNVVQRISDRLYEGGARDRAAIWIRCLPSTATPQAEAEQDRRFSLEGRESRR